ncbi:hypothetical protein VTJ49DRAFT_874 [Mycothermus thermophilus]|uniref:ubiquitinyl hydrolase 1 n=1 Tax=Humicola insolens TaxID=85995 RepID=A0ABR3VP29_HUMIN
MCVDEVTVRLTGLDVGAFPAPANSQSLVTQNTGMAAAGRGGRIASRLIQDWLAGRPVKAIQGDDGLADARNGEPQTECPPLRVFPPRPDAGPDHDLLIISSQSYDDAHDPEGLRRSLISCMCRYCRYHFAFHICPQADDDGTHHLQHHFRVDHAEWHNISDSTVLQPQQQNPCLGQFRYTCTVCSLAIHLEISLPRLKPEWIKKIMDETRVRKSLRMAREKDPGRYADITAEKETHLLTGALYTLNQYLKNIVEDDGTGPRKRISRRNKTFLVQFGLDCDPIFEYLGFELEHDITTGETYWLPPRLQPHEGKTPIGSKRAFYEDVRSEVQSLLDDKPPVDGQPVVKPVLSARDSLEKALRCDKSHRSVSTLPERPDEAQHFATLGVPADADDALLKFAYNRQVDTDPDNAGGYLEALGNLAGRRSEDLQMFVFTHQEVLAKGHEWGKGAAPPPVPPDDREKPYSHFGLTRDCSEGPSYLISVYRTYRDQSPAQKSDHRLALLEIAMDRNSEELRQEVFGSPMDLAEASSAQTSASDSIPGRTALVVMALEAISASRPWDDPNRDAFEDVLAELRSSTQPPFTQAGSAIAHGQDSDLERPREVVDLDLPVGLVNLRNTCYLNSILQYFYSVNVVRDLAFNEELPAIEPTEENLRNILRITTTNRNNAATDSSENDASLETGRAFVGYEFTRELSNLFRELDATGDSSISPRQRLANAALLRAGTVVSVAKSVTASEATKPQPELTGETSIAATTDTPMEDVDKCEVASTGSSQTLVDQPDSQGLLAVTAEGPDSLKDTLTTVDGPADPKAHPAVDGTGDDIVKKSKLTIEELAVELDKPNVGSDQMDVDEVMGNAIEHLRAAFKISHADSSDAMPDPIEKAFFSTFIDNRKKVDEKDWTRTKRSDRWVTAFPPRSGTQDLYDALSNSFDLESMSDNLLSFTTIEHPAPHFHICIQRNDGQGKNANAITIPETLYLDRFMHIEDTNSELFKKRKRYWDIKARLSQLGASGKREGPEVAGGESRANGRASNPTTGLADLTTEEVDGYMVIGARDAPASVLPASKESAPNGQSSADDLTPISDLQDLLTKYEIVPYEAPPTTAVGSPPTLDEIPPLPQVELNEFWDGFTTKEKAEREALIAERDGFFDEFRSVPYRLHAVVCHAGSTARAGHYWVWIHDFERDVWRKYNDTTVTVHPAEFVFEQLNTKGEPYYLAYVKADEVHNLVSVPRRKPQDPPPVPPRPPRAVPEAPMDESVNGQVMTSVEQVEDVEMRPPPYSW